MGPFAATPRPLARALVVLLAAAPASGCAYLFAAVDPIQVSAERGVDRFAPETTHLEAKSSEQSHLSGRNNLTLEAVVSERSASRVTIDALLASTELLNVDPHNFYVTLEGGGRSAQVSQVVLGELKNRPYHYNYTYDVTVEAGKVAFSDGTSATIYERQTRVGHGQENYFVQPVQLIFEGDDVPAPDAPELVLQLDDLGVAMKLRWARSGATP